MTILYDNPHFKYKNKLSNKFKLSCLQVFALSGRSNYVLQLPSTNLAV